MEILRPFITRNSFHGQFVLVEKGRLAKEMQAVYGDILMNGKDGGLCAVEIKAEEENRHGNLFIELWSNRHWFNLGWLYKLDADVLLYHFIQDDELYAMSFPEMRKWLLWHPSGEKPRLYRYGPRLQKKHDQLNDTWGACIPITHISSGLKSFKQFVASTGERVEAGRDLFGGEAA